MKVAAAGPLSSSDHDRQRHLKPRFPGKSPSCWMMHHNVLYDASAGGTTQALTVIVTTCYQRMRGSQRLDNSRTQVFDTCGLYAQSRHEVRQRTTSGEASAAPSSSNPFEHIYQHAEGNK